MIDCTVLVLTYKGLEHLRHLLPSLEQAITNAEQFEIESIILDNSKDKYVENFVISNFSAFKYIACKNNYLFSYNEVIGNLENKSNYVLLLNDDLRVSKNIFNDALPFFNKDNNLFAISCLFKDWKSNQIQYSWSDMLIEKGWMKLKKSREQQTEAIYSFYACGGASFYRVDMFRALNGFDAIYSPAYYEDTDLSHRAWLRGWKTVAHPTAYVKHRIGGSWKNSKNEKELHILQQRNRIIGMLVNCHNPNFLINFFLYLPYRLLYSLLFQYPTFAAYMLAFKKTREIISRRKRNTKGSYNFQLHIGKKF